MSRETLHQLIKNKLCQAELKREHVATVAEVLVYTGAKGTHSHGVVRVGYCAKRISKDGADHEPELRFREAGPCSAILYADNAAGQAVTRMSVEHAIKTTQQKGVTVVGISRMGHSGTISYFVQQTTRAGLTGISLCQSSPMVVPFGDAEIYYGTNPLIFAAPGEGDEALTFDMTTIVQAWGKVFDARLRNMSIPDTQAVNKDDTPTTDPSAVYALLPAAGPKGYDLMMMIDVLSDVLLDLPFG